MPLHDKPNMPMPEPEQPLNQEQNPTASGEQLAPSLDAQQTGTPEPPQPDPASYAGFGTPAGPGPEQQMPGDAAIAYKDINKEAEQAAGPAVQRQPGQDWMSDEQVQQQTLYDQSLAIGKEWEKFGYHEVGKYNTYVHVPDVDRPIARWGRARVIGAETPPPGFEADPGFIKQMLWGEKPGNYVEHTSIAGRPVRDIWTKDPVLDEDHTPSMFMPFWADSPVEVYFPVYEGMSDGEALEEMQRLGIEAQVQSWGAHKAKIFGAAEAASLGAVHFIPGYAQAREEVAQETPPWHSDAAFGAGHVMAIAPQFKVFGTIMQPVHKMISKGLATSVEKAAAKEIAKTGVKSIDDALQAVTAAKESGKIFSPTGAMSKLWQGAAKRVRPGTHRTLERAWQAVAKEGAVPQGVVGETLVLGIPKATFESAAGQTLLRAAQQFRHEMGEEVAKSALFRFTALSANVAAGTAVDMTLGTAQAAGAALANTSLTPEQRAEQLRAAPMAGLQEGMVGATFEILTSAVPGMAGAFAPGKLRAKSGPTPGQVWGAAGRPIPPTRQPGPEIASPGASQHRSLRVVPPPSPGADAQASMVATEIQTNLQNSTDGVVPAQVDHTLRGLTRSQYETAQRGARAAEMGDQAGYQMAQAELKMNSEIIVKRMEALRDLAHGDLDAASVAAGTDLQRLLHQPAVDPQTGMVEGVLWDLARWAEPLGRKLDELDPDTRKNIIMGLPELGSHLDVVAMKDRLTTLATALARADSNAAVGPPKGVNFDGPIPKDLVGRAQSSPTPRPDLGLKRDMRVEDAPTSDDWIDDPSKAVAHNQVLADQLVSGHASVPLGAISMDPKLLPSYEAPGLIDLGDGRVGAPVYLEDGRAVVMRSHPEGGMYAVDISNGVEAAMFPAEADPTVVNGDLSPFEWDIDEAGKFLITGQTPANKKAQDIFKQQVRDIEQDGPPLGSTPDQLFQTAVTHEFKHAESYQEMLNQADKLEANMASPTLKDAARYYPRDLAYDRLLELEPVNQTSEDVQRLVSKNKQGYDPNAEPQRPLQTNGFVDVVTGIEANVRGKWNADQLGKYLEKQGLTGSEVDALNLEDAFAGRKTIARTDLLDWLYENTLKTEVHDFADFPRLQSRWTNRNGVYTAQTVTPRELTSMSTNGGGLSPATIEIRSADGVAWEAFVKSTDPDPNSTTVLEEPLGLISETPEAVMDLVERTIKQSAPDQSEWTYPLSGGKNYQQVTIRSPLAAEMTSSQDVAMARSQVENLEAEMQRLEVLIADDPSRPMLNEYQTVKAEHVRAVRTLEALEEVKASGQVPATSDQVGSFTMDRHVIGDKQVDVLQEVHSDLVTQKRTMHKDRVVAMAHRYQILPPHVDAMNSKLNIRDLEEKVRIMATDWELEILDADGTALAPVSEIPASWESSAMDTSEAGSLARINKLRTSGVANSPLLDPTHQAGVHLKTALRHAAERGATHLAITNGQINTARHNRVKLDSVKITPHEDGTLTVDYTGDDTQGTRTIDSERQLADVLGTTLAEVATKRLGGKPDMDSNSYTLSAAELESAGTAPWARELYDEVLPRAAKRLIKKQKWDTKLEPLDLDYSATLRGDDTDTPLLDDGDAWDTAYEAEMADWTRRTSLEPRWPGLLSKNPATQARAMASLEAHEIEFGKWHPETGQAADWVIVDDAGHVKKEIRGTSKEDAQQQYTDFGNEVISESVGTRAQEMLDADAKRQAEIREGWEYGKEDADKPEGIEPLQMIKITPKMRRALLGEDTTVAKDGEKVYELREDEPSLDDVNAVLEEIGWTPEITWQGGVGRIAKATPRMSKSGNLNLRGQTAADPETQAALMRPWRSKHTETLHYLMSGETSGAVEGHLSYSSRMAGSAGIFDWSKATRRAVDEAIERGASPEEFLKIRDNEIARQANEMARRVRRIAAKKNENIVIDMVHNHPSGNVNFSRADAFVTAAMKLALEKEGVTLRHHLVLNHDTFGVLDGPALESYFKGGARSPKIGEVRDLPQFKNVEDPLAIPEQPYFLLGKSTKTPGDVAEIGAIINQNPDEFVGVLYSDAQLKATGMEIIPRSWLKNPRMIEEWLRGRKREYGAANAFLHHPKIDAQMADTGSTLVKSDAITDFVDDTGMSLGRSNMKTPQEQFMLDQKAAMVGGRVMEGKADYDTRMKALKYAEEGGSFSKEPELFQALKDDEKSNAMLGRLARGYISNKVQLDRLNPARWDEQPPSYFGDWKPTEDVKAQMQQAWDARKAAFETEVETIDRVKNIAKGEMIADEDLASIQPETLNKIMREDPELFDRFSQQYWRSYDTVLESLSSKDGLEIMKAEAALDVIDDMITAKFEEGLDTAEQGADVHAADVSHRLAQAAHALQGTGRGCQGRAHGPGHLQHPVEGPDQDE
jgi:hypothetical protein